MFIVSNKNCIYTYFIKIVDQSKDPCLTAFTFSFVCAISFADFSINAKQ